MWTSELKMENDGLAIIESWHCSFQIQETSEKDVRVLGALARRNLVANARSHESECLLTCL